MDGFENRMTLKECAQRREGRREERDAPRLDQGSQGVVRHRRYSFDDWLGHETNEVLPPLAYQQEIESDILHMNNFNVEVRWRTFAEDAEEGNVDWGFLMYGVPRLDWARMPYVEDSSDQEEHASQAQEPAQVQQDIHNPQLNETQQHELTLALTETVESPSGPESSPVFGDLNEPEQPPAPASSLQSQDCSKTPHDTEDQATTHGQQSAQPQDTGHLQQHNHNHHLAHHHTHQNLPTIQVKQFGEETLPLAIDARVLSEHYINGGVEMPESQAAQRDSSESSSDSEGLYDVSDDDDEPEHSEVSDQAHGIREPRASPDCDDTEPLGQMQREQPTTHDPTEPPSGHEPPPVEPSGGSLSISSSVTTSGYRRSASDPLLGSPSHSDSIIRERQHTHNILEGRTHLGVLPDGGMGQGSSGDGRPVAESSDSEGVFDFEQHTEEERPSNIVDPAPAENRPAFELSRESYNTEAAQETAERHRPTGPSWPGALRGQVEPSGANRQREAYDGDDEVSPTREARQSQSVGICGSPLRRKRTDTERPSPVEESSPTEQPESRRERKTAPDEHASPDGGVRLERSPQGRRQFKRGFKKVRWNTEQPPTACSKQKPEATQRGPSQQNVAPPQSARQPSVTAQQTHAAGQWRLPLPPQQVVPHEQAPVIPRYSALSLDYVRNRLESGVSYGFQVRERVYEGDGGNSGPPSGAPRPSATSDESQRAVEHEPQEAQRQNEPQKEDAENVGKEAERSSEQEQHGGEGQVEPEQQGEEQEDKASGGQHHKDSLGNILSRDQDTT